MVDLLTGAVVVVVLCAGAVVANKAATIYEGRLARPRREQRIVTTMLVAVCVFAFVVVASERSIGAAVVMLPASTFLFGLLRLAEAHRWVQEMRYIRALQDRADIYSAMFPYTAEALNERRAKNRWLRWLGGKPLGPLYIYKSDVPDDSASIEIRNRDRDPPELPGFDASFDEDDTMSGNCSRSDDGDICRHSRGT